ncbi:uncharacterized protein PHACADRAFT_259197 [Phanerochaete carnosa HHB-10118-sp]|uniref:Uncharacterized protein n=1 Tax=Phanerochaete carnosa (strain HHB-10118-sp) TaxID=650164 RepID=K5W299_PHACS|nr:uncharacterized protein PHACADRAFT_259197 [Phanerochaete carnosa HHB-10118-sp]EKM53024.1 hypothetical protein PHACADRAFT_259197 [Phanerochaete carnosa HHB-10118-sp]
MSLCEVNYFAFGYVRMDSRLREGAGRGILGQCCVSIVRVGSQLSEKVTRSQRRRQAEKALKFGPDNFVQAQLPG